LEVDCWPAETFLLSDDWANKGAEDWHVGRQLETLLNLGRLIDECAVPFSSFQRRACAGIDPVSRIYYFREKFPTLLGMYPRVRAALKIDRQLERTSAFFHATHQACSGWASGDRRDRRESGVATPLAYV